MFAELRAYSGGTKIGGGLLQEQRSWQAPLPFPTTAYLAPWGNQHQHSPPNLLPQVPLHPTALPLLCRAFVDPPLRNGLLQPWYCRVPPAEDRQPQNIATLPIQTLCILQIHPFQYALGLSPSKAVPQAWQVCKQPSQ